MSEMDRNSGLNQPPAENTPQADGSPFARAHHVLLFFVAAALLVWLLSGFYQIRSDQIGIVERLGQFVTDVDGNVAHLQPGLHYHLPWPIDRVNLVSVQQVYSMPVTAFNASPAEYAEFKLALQRQGWPKENIDAIFNPYLITGDKSVANMEINVLFRIDDPAAWLMSVSHEYQMGYDPSQTSDTRNIYFQQLAEQSILSQVSRMTLQEVVRDKRAELGQGIQNALQDAMVVTDISDPTGATKINLGAEIQLVTISDSHVPDAVKSAYDNLNTQQNKAKTVETDAQTKADSTRAKAEGEKSTLMADAQSYYDTTVQSATGDAARFAQVLVQYNNAPEITRWTLFTEAATAVTQAAKRIVFAQPGQRTVITVDQPQYDANQVRVQQGNAP